MSEIPPSPRALDVGMRNTRRTDHPTSVPSSRLFAGHSRGHSMHRTLQALGVLSLAAVISSAASAQAPTRISQQPQDPQEMGPPMPAELAGTPRATSTRMSPMAAALSATAKDIRTNARAGTLENPRT